MKKIIDVIIKIVQWSLAVILAILSLGILFNSLLAGIVMLFATVIVCPLTRNKAIIFFEEKFGDKSPLKKIKGWMYALIAFMLICISIGITPTVENDYAGTTTNTTSAETINEGGEMVVPTATPKTVATPKPTIAPMASATPEPAVTPSPKPTVTPNPTATPTPTAEPTAVPTTEPTLPPTAAPTANPTAEPTVAPVTETVQNTNNSSKGSYAVNGKNGKIHMVGQCPATGTGENAMDNPVYFATYDEAESYSISIKPNESKRKCGNCW